MSLLLIQAQMMRVISSPSSSTTGFFTLILFIGSPETRAGDFRALYRGSVVKIQWLRGVFGLILAHRRGTFMIGARLIKVLPDPAASAAWPWQVRAGFHQYF